MNLPVTLTVLCVAVALFAFGSWRSAQPADPLNPRMIPWRPVIIIAGVIALLMLVHLVNLAGVSTGANQLGSRRFP
jgi:amino acid transporter